MLLLPRLWRPEPASVIVQGDVVKVTTLMITCVSLLPWEQDKPLMGKSQAHSSQLPASPTTRAYQNGTPWAHRLSGWRTPTTLYWHPQCRSRVHEFEACLHVFQCWTPSLTIVRYLVDFFISPTPFQKLLCLVCLVKTEDTVFQLWLTISIIKTFDTYFWKPLRK